VAALITAWFGVHRDREADRRALRDRKAERLRRVYGELILIVMTMKSRARAWRWEQHAPAGETPEQHGARIQRLLDEAKVNINRLQAELLLESDAPAGKLLEIFEQLEGRLFVYVSAIIDNIQAPGTFEPAEVQAARHQVEGTADQIAQVAREHLFKLERPIGPAFPWSRSQAGRLIQKDKTRAQ
jgi:hypothetical protein